MANLQKTPEFRFYYFTNRYKETVSFYQNRLGLEKLSDWDRGVNEKGTVFLSPNKTGSIEIEEAAEAPAFSGCGLCIEVTDVDEWYRLVIQNSVTISQPLKDAEYGHRNFKIKDVNGLIISFFKKLTS